MHPTLSRPPAFETFTRSAALAEYGEYATDRHQGLSPHTLPEDDRYATVMALADEVAVTSAVSADTEVTVIAAGQCVFHAVERYDGGFAVFVFEPGGWVGTLNAAFAQLSPRR